MSRTVLLYVEPFPGHWHLSLKMGPTPHLHIPALVVLGMYMQFLLRSLDNSKGCIVPSDLFALAAVRETWADHLSLLLMVTPRYGELSTCSNYTPQKTFSLGWVVPMFLCSLAMAKQSNQSMKSPFEWTWLIGAASQS